MIVKQLAHDDGQSPTRWGIAVVTMTGEIQVLSESRETKAEAQAEALRIMGWQSMVKAGVVPITVNIGAFEIVVNPPGARSVVATPLEAAAEDRALRSLDGVA